MATLGFGSDYWDNPNVDMSALGGDKGPGDNALADFFGGFDTPANTQPLSDASNASDTGKKRDVWGNFIDSGYDPGRNFLTPADIQSQGLHQGDWSGAAAYANSQNQANIANYGRLPEDMSKGLPKEQAGGTHILTASDVQAMGLHQDDYGAAQRYADNVNKRNAETAIGMTPDQIKLMGSDVNKPALPDMTGTPAAAAGPQAMAAGQGWYIDEQGRFHSDNEGANLRANMANWNEARSIGPGTIIDQGAPRTAVGTPTGTPLGQGQISAQDLVNQGRQIPGVGLTGAPLLPDMQGVNGLNPNGPQAQGGGTTGGTNQIGPGGLAYNPRLGDTVAQTYGTPGQNPNAPQGGAQNLPQGFTRQGAQGRIITGPDGTVYIADPNGFLNPNADQARAWQSRAAIDQNAVTGFAPDAIEKIRYLDSQGLSTPEEKRFLQTIGSGTDFMNTQSYADWANRHNAESTRLGISNQQVNVPTRILPMDQVFPVMKEYGDLLKQLGATNITIRPDNHTTYGLGDGSAIMQWRSANGNQMKLSGDTPLANVLDDLASLRQIAAQQQQQQAEAAASASSARSSGYGARAGYGGGGGYGYGGTAGGGGGNVTTQGTGTPANVPMPPGVFEGGANAIRGYGDEIFAQPAAPGMAGAPGAPGIVPGTEGTTTTNAPPFYFGGDVASRGYGDVYAQPAVAPQFVAPGMGASGYVDTTGGVQPYMSNAYQNNIPTQEDLYGMPNSGPALGFAPIGNTFAGLPGDIVDAGQGIGQGAVAAGQAIGNAADWWNENVNVRPTTKTR